MSMKVDVEVFWQTRECQVEDEIGYFHLWEQNSKGVFGIVEFLDGNRRVDPTDIHFVDEQHEILNDLNERSKYGK